MDVRDCYDEGIVIIVDIQFLCVRDYIIIIIIVGWLDIICGNVCVQDF